MPTTGGQPSKLQIATVSELAQCLSLDENVFQLHLHRLYRQARSICTGRALGVLTIEHTTDLGRFRDWQVYSIALTDGGPQVVHSTSNYTPHQVLKGTERLARCNPLLS